MGRGRPPKAGTAEEKAAARRERVRNNVRALRLRRKQESALLKKELGADLLQVPWPDEKDSSSSATPASLEDLTDEKDSDTVLGLEAKPLYPKVLLYNDDHALPPAISARNSYTAALVANVRVQFLPDAVYLPPDSGVIKSRPWESTEILWTPCAFWINSAFSKAAKTNNSLLKTTLLAIGTLLKSIEFSDHALRLTSMGIYRRCLQGIRKALEPIMVGGEKPKDVASLFLTCHAAAMYELCQTNDTRASMFHLRGVSRLICHLGVDGDAEAQAEGWLFLQDYRHAELALCLKYRYLSYASDAERRFNLMSAGEGEDPRQSLNKGRHNLIVIIADLADEVAGVMVELDKMKVASTSGNILRNCEGLVKRLRITWSKFQYVYDQITAKYGSAFVHSDDEVSHSGYVLVTFKTYDIGVAWCYCLMVQLYCIATEIEIIYFALDQISSIDATFCAVSAQETDGMSAALFSPGEVERSRTTYRRLCIQLAQCIYYFLQTDKGITGAVIAIFPLDTVVEMLDAELARLRNDRTSADIVGASEARVKEIETNIENLTQAQALCDQFEAQARALGLRTADIKTQEQE